MTSDERQRSSIGACTLFGLVLFGANWPTFGFLGLVFPFIGLGAAEVGQTVARRLSWQAAPGYRQLAPAALAAAILITINALVAGPTADKAALVAALFARGLLASVLAFGVGAWGAARVADD